MVTKLGEKSPTNFRKEFVMDNQFNNYQLIADACGLDLKINYWESYDKDDSVHKHDFDYILTKGGEKVVHCIDFNAVARKLAMYIFTKEVTDVNRGIYLHNKNGVTEYR
tara:strand:+ start:201 stop:527 length:327 start_codon:yes stop_codon:yes gene_type:complete